MLKEKGILLLCFGHAYFGRLAYNLCATIKAVEDIPVAVVHGGKALSHLSETQLAIFDHVIQLPEHIGNVGGFAPKLYLNELTPFEETLFLDVDMLWLPYRKPSELFEALKDVEYTGITEGWCDIETLNCDNINKAYYFWADLNEIKTVYKLKEGKIYQWRSEVVYFKKTARVEKFFKKAQAIYANPKLKTVKKFGTHIPDELAINIAAAIVGIEPHKEKWTPAFWYSLNRDRVPGMTELSRWFLVSFGGKDAMGAIKKLYDSVASQAFKKIGRQHLFSLHSKSSYLPERAKI